MTNVDSDLSQDTEQDTEQGAGSAPTPAFPLSAIEKPLARPPGLREIARDLTPEEAGNGLVALIFSASGPLAVILAAAAAGGLSAEQSSSWIFGAFFGNGLLTLFLTWYYRSPQAYFWTIPGTVLAGDALTHLSYAEVIGAYLVTGVLVAVLGWTGLVGLIMRAIPHSIVMAMVAGVFLTFGLNLVTSTEASPLLGLPMIAVFVALSMMPRLGAVFPPALAAAVVGTVIAIVAGRFEGDVLADGVIARPVLTAPEFSVAAIVELVIPLAITVIIVQNGQGVAVLSAAGHTQGPNLSAFASGLWAIPQGLIGASPTCLTGPTNALLVTSRHAERHYTAALTNGATALLVGLIAPITVAFMLGMPGEFIAVLAGVAMLTPLRAAFLAAFSGRTSTGALVCLLVTVADLTLLGISAPFWGIVIGCLVAWLLDRSS
ncbi:benzoate/H(+) symporter BenE family transporter [Corynebacterium guangdongense]|uniref:Benzoate membrane transport protein n=1 Tax=Corynebacterium guangdongense TaxID=1783348 RepID=A0ABU1ZYY2_9CORY|nr:benzoate/H(+) symporter BenE family transporter [Corynebacterium guangdongense]MDR7330055.1 benzoate membrane transport protein [Corynebacterium guangdongense]WJZ18613.1 Inner membrane protein YdcO [Corynebacterium guangdongense]